MSAIKEWNNAMLIKANAGLLRITVGAPINPHSFTAVANLLVLLHFSLNADISCNTIGAWYKPSVATPKPVSSTYLEC